MPSRGDITHVLTPRGRRILVDKFVSLIREGCSLYPTPGIELSELCTAWGISYTSTMDHIEYDLGIDVSALCTHRAYECHRTRKAKPKMHIYPSPDGVGHPFTFYWTQAACDLIKQFPGVRYAPEIKRGTWWAPVEAIPWLRDCAQRLQMDWEYAPGMAVDLGRKAPNLDGLYPYQADVVEWAAGQRSALLALDMGLGKTACAVRLLETIPDLENKRTLIVCPAAVKSQWLDQLELWATEKPKFERKRTIGVRDLDSINCGQYIASYASLGAINEAAIPWDVIVWDEIHYLSNSKSQRSRHALDIAHRCKPEMQLGLTGTPIPDKPTDLWHPLEVLYPGRCGTWFGFARRYAQGTKNAYAHSGWSFSGLNPLFAPELADRLKYTTRRVTKAEVAHLLPPFTLTRMDLQGGAATKGFTVNSQGHQKLIGAQRKLRVQAAYCWAEERLAAGKNHLVIFTHTRETAKAIARIMKTCKGTVIDGSVKPDERDNAIKIARASDQSIIVATMASCGIGLNSMTQYDTGLLAELPYWPAETLQAMARLHRLGSPNVVNLTILGADDPISQTIEYAIRSKLSSMNDILAGGTEKALNEALSPNETLEDWRARLLNLDEVDDD